MPLEYKTTTVTHKDADGNESKSDVKYATVNEDSDVEYVENRDGTRRDLRKGDVVIPVGGNKHDVFTATEWDKMWSDTDRVVDAGDIRKREEPVTVERGGETAVAVTPEDERPVSGSLVDESNDRDYQRNFDERNDRVTATDPNRWESRTTDERRSDERVFGDNRDSDRGNPN